MKSKTKVLNVNGSPVISGKPVLKNPIIVAGIKDRLAAQAWGERNGFATVYFWPRRNRVYAEMLQAQVDVVAQKIEQASIELLADAEA
jgi:hypothetical protein